MEQAFREDIKPVRLTRHAEERMKSFGIGYKKVVYMLLHSSEEKPLHMSRYKAERYGDNGDVRHLRFGTFMFTVRNQPDRKDGKPITLVITLIDQRVTLGESHKPKGEKDTLWPRV